MNNHTLDGSFFLLSVLEETEGLEDAVSAILYYQRTKPEEPAYKWNILWYVEMLVLFSNSNRLFSHTSGLQVREVEYQNIIYMVHALQCASNKAFCLRKKQTNNNNNKNHEENSLQQHSLQQHQSRRKTKQLKKMFLESQGKEVIPWLGESFRYHCQVSIKKPIIVPAGYQQCRKCRFLLLVKRNQTSVKTMPWLILALLTPLILKRLSSELVQTYSK